MARPPDILVAADARTVAVRGPGGKLMFPRRPRDAFAARNWLERDGDLRLPRAAMGGGTCDAYSCLVKTGQGLLALPLRPEAVREDCARAVIVIAAVTVKNCKGPKLVLDSDAVARGQGFAITDGHAQSVRAWRGKRPWSP